MNAYIVAGSVAELQTDALVLGLFAPTDKRFNLSGYAAEIDTASMGALSAMLETGDFTAKPGQTAVLYHLAEVAACRVILVGLGKSGELTEKNFIKAVKNAVTATHAKNFVLALDAFPSERDAVWAARTAMRTAVFATVKTPNLKTVGKKEADVAQHTAPESISWAGDDKDEALQQAVYEGCTIGRAMVWAKELAELPPNICDPEFMSQAAKSLEEVCIAAKSGDSGKKAAQGNVVCTVLGPKEIDEAGMGGLMAVSQGSAVPAVFIEVSYNGAGKEKAPVVFVGKGVTFDAGGISLKPARNMDAMKFDMSGAAVALAMVKLASELQLNENVTALVPCTENLPSGSAVKPADIITMKNGMTVEVLNTDAEGRLIMADALSRAQELNPSVCIDVATLTGACIVALGNDVSGLFCNDEMLTGQLAISAENTADAVWPMPMGGVYREMLESSCADIANVGCRPDSGACTAASFLQAFAPKCAWAHLDVAGTANTMGTVKTSSARPLPLLADWLISRAKREETLTQKSSSGMKKSKTVKTGKSRKAKTLDSVQNS